MSEEHCDIACKEMQEVQNVIFGKDGKRTGIAYQIEQKVDKKILEHYIKKPPSMICVAFILFFLGQLISSIYSGYRIYYVVQAVPEVQAAERKIEDKIVEVEKEHAIMGQIIRSLVDTQKGFASSLKELQKQQIELTHELTIHIQREKEINEEFLRELKKIIKK